MWKEKRKEICKGRRGVERFKKVEKEKEGDMSS